MNSQHAWQATLGQLQMQMPKSAYDTWVRSAELVSYDQDLFTIGVHNAYARDWLETRLRFDCPERSDWLDEPPPIGAVCRLA